MTTDELIELAARALWESGESSPWIGVRESFKDEYRDAAEIVIRIALEEAIRVAEEMARECDPRYGDGYPQATAEEIADRTRALRRRRMAMEDDVEARFGLVPEAIVNRYRAHWIVVTPDEDEVEIGVKAGFLAIRARDGSSNPISVEAVRRANFEGTYEDTFDSTYRYYYYSPIQEPAP